MAELTKKRWLRDFTKASTYKVFLALERLGLHVLPEHYYSPIPNHRWLKGNRHLWSAPVHLEANFNWDLDAQVKWLKGVCAPFYREVEGLLVHREVAQSGVGIGFGQPESQVLHCFMRNAAPPTVIEIGSGLSTAFMLHAVDLNQAEGRSITRIKCIEPNPRKALRATAAIELIEEPCQAVPLSMFQALRSGDLLFVDSTHSVRTGSDVVRIYLQIIPCLAPGVFVHVHDINFPFSYQRDALSGFWGSQETALLMALLTGNDRLEVLASLSALHYERSAQLQTLLTDYRPEANDEGLRVRPRREEHYPSSIWLRTVASSESRGDI